MQITALEMTLQAIASEMLQSESGMVSVEEDFAQLGFDSLMALRFARRVNEQTGHVVELESLYDYPSIRTLARHLSQSERKAA